MINPRELINDSRFDELRKLDKQLEALRGYMGPITELMSEHEYIEQYTMYKEMIDDEEMVMYGIFDMELGDEEDLSCCM